MVVRGRLHQLPLKEGSIVTLICEGDLEEGMYAWQLPIEGTKLQIYHSDAMGALMCFGVSSRNWHTVRGEWEVFIDEPIPSVEEML